MNLGSTTRDDLRSITITPEQEANLGVHPAAELFPLLSGAAAEEFKRDLQTSGLRKSIVLVRGKEKDELLTALSKKIANVNQIKN